MSDHAAARGQPAPKGVAAVAAGSLFAGLIHAGVCPAHFREGLAIGAFFVVVALLQIGWAAAVVTRPRAGLLLAGAAGNAAAVWVWAISRTAGIPLGPHPWQPERVGLIDALTIAVELGVIVGAVFLVPRRAPAAASTSRPTRGGRSRVLSWLPQGGALPDEVWARRHRGIVVLLCLHAPGLFFFSLVRGAPVLEATLVGGIVASFAASARTFRGDRRPAAVVAAMGLLTSSALLVYESGGVIEMHFHYFVVVGIITLYQDWWPFLVAIGYVVLQHGVLGVMNPVAVYDHQSAIASPWQWAGVHGLFVVAMSAAGIASWRLNEALLMGVTERQQKLEEAQHAARLGAWEHDAITGKTVWSDEIYRLLGLDHNTRPGVEPLLSCVHPEDRLIVGEGVTAALTGSRPFAADFRVLREDGTVRWLQGRTRETAELDGSVVQIAGTLQDITERKESEFALRGTMSLLNATLDATADGILVVDNDGIISSFNRRFVDLWRVPEEILNRRNDDEALAFVLSQLADPEAFLAKVRELYAQPDMDSRDELLFRDGRVFERFSTPQRVGGQTVGRVWSFRDVTEQKRVERELAHQAFHDPLTDLANQALFRDRVEHALARADRHDKRVAVLFVDLDNFKTVNDSLGHTAGNAILVTVGERLRSCVRTSDTAARLGGDEFAILIEDIGDSRSVLDVAGRILAELRSPVASADRDIVIGASIGIAFASSATTADELLRNADLAMYSAKRRGKGRYEIYEADMHRAVLERLELEGDLRRGLARGEMVVHYQPIVSLVSGATTGVEALVRWRHPTRGLLTPDEFISVTEDTGLIRELGRQVLTAACNDAIRLQRALPALPALTVSVNVSPTQLQGDGFVDQVSAALQAAGLPASALILEITESALMDDGETVLARLRALKALGLRLALDDFGTGYSSLGRLERFPIDILKIDRSFVSGLGRTQRTRASLAQAMLALAQTLCLDVIAEGVETEAQADALRGFGCVHAQGYLFSRPLPADEIAAFIGSSSTSPAPAVPSGPTTRI